LPLAVTIAVTITVAIAIAVAVAAAVAIAIASAISPQKGGGPHWRVVALAQLQLYLNNLSK
jgi:hypothetical protein